jgi:hypothetical protein
MAGRLVKTSSNIMPASEAIAIIPAALEIINAVCALVIVLATSPTRSAADAARRLGLILKRAVFDNHLATIKPAQPRIIMTYQATEGT